MRSPGCRFQRRDPGFQRFDTLKRGGGQRLERLNLVPPGQIHIRNKALHTRAHRGLRFFSSGARGAHRPGHQACNVV